MKLTGDRLLFIVISWGFSVTLTIVLDFIAGGNNVTKGIFYSIATATPYLMLIYYEAFDVGHRERNRETASMKNGVLYCLFWQIPSLIFMALEWGFFLVSYYMGMKDIVLIKPKKSSGSMKK